MLHDEKTGAELTPIHAISDAKASFVVHNSPLTEAAILGYEFGYNLEDQTLYLFGKLNMEILLIWHK